MIARIRRLLDDERIRYVIIGGINTVVGYGIYVIVQMTLDRYIHYMGSLYVSFVPSVLVAFFLHRTFTFRATGSGKFLLDLARFSSVYIVGLVINTIALPLIVELFKLNPLVAQAFVVIGVTVISYVGHKFFSFRRPIAVEKAVDPVA